MLTRRRIGEFLTAGAALAALPRAARSAGRAGQNRMAQFAGPIAAAEGPVFRSGLDAGGIAELARQGYVEEEYFVFGATRGGSFESTLLLRKPGPNRRFSGLVIVEPLHVSGQSVLWPFKDVILGAGHAFALVGAQRGPLERAIRPVNPRRYRSLHIPAAAPRPAQDRPVLEGVLAQAPARLKPMLLATEADAPIAFEIMSQVGALLKSDAAAGLFARRPVHWLITGGVSQTGELTLKYLQHGARDGASVYDGFFPVAATGGRPLPPHRGAVVHVVGEADYLNFAKASGPSYRRPDSDAADDLYRLYEVAGASHECTRRADLNARRWAEATAMLAPGEMASQFPSRIIYAAALRNLIAWVRHGEPPPRAARLALAKNGVVLRDRWGNALGGVRSSSLQVPIARYIAAAPVTPATPEFNRHFIGLEVPFNSILLQRLYRSHGGYVAAVRASLTSLASDHWIDEDGAAQLLADAQASQIF